MGGWNMLWFDDDWYELMDFDFVFWIFEELELWIEVFFDGIWFLVIQWIIQYDGNLLLLFWQLCDVVCQ